MSEFKISISEGQNKRLLTGGKYCPNDILIAAENHTAIKKKDVNFYDYDGTVLYSYTLTEVQALAELPPSPTPPRDFLEFDEWNWTLEQIQSVGAPVDVGAVYRPVDGYTRAVLDITNTLLSDVTVHIQTWHYEDLLLPVAIVDWGDGEQTELFHETHGAAGHTLHHKYQSIGTYTIKIINSSTFDLSLNTESTPFIGNGAATTILKEFYQGDASRLTTYGLFNQTGLKFFFANKKQSKLWGQAVRNNYSLKAVILPSSFTEIGAYCFANDPSVNVVSLPYHLTNMEYDCLSGINATRLTIPPKVTDVYAGTMRTLQSLHFTGTVTTLGSNVVDGSCALPEIHLPESISTIETAALRNCYSLVEFVIPPSVTSIDAQALYNCTSLKRLVFRASTPPNVSNANAFTGIPADCVVEVPSEALTVYQEATNYAPIAAQMLGV